MSERDDYQDLTDAIKTFIGKNGYSEAVGVLEAVLRMERIPMETEDVFLNEFISAIGTARVVEIHFRVNGEGLKPSDQAMRIYRGGYHKAAFEIWGIDSRLTPGMVPEHVLHWWFRKHIKEEQGGN